MRNRGPQPTVAFRCVCGTSIIGTASVVEHLAETHMMDYCPFAERGVSEEDQG